MVVRIRHLPTIMAAMLNENDEMYWGGDQRTTIYNHSQPADLRTHCKHTILNREPLPSCFYCPSLQLLDRGDGKAFSRLRYRPHAGRRVWAMPSEKWMTGKDKGNGGWAGKGEEREREVAWGDRLMSACWLSDENASVKWKLICNSFKFLWIGWESLRVKLKFGELERKRRGVLTWSSQ